MFHQSLPVDLFILAKQQTIDFTNKSMFISIASTFLKKGFKEKAGGFG
jgi:hypothetical protein